ncbi:MAG: seg [Parcubacteria group bacterium]|nr:seg [Parcubacteria group bacterium]
MKFTSFALLVGILFSPVLIHAQVPSIDGTEDILASGIILNLTPQYPAPGDTVTARLQSSTIDLGTATITWSLNKIGAKSGLGLTSFTLTAPSTGETTIGVSIKSNQGDFTKTFTVSSGSVDLLWQGSGYTPPFYKGKTLWTHQTTLTLLAIPHVGKSASTLIYKWYLDGEVMGQVSGTGRSSFSFTGSLLRQPRTVKVEILTDRDTTVASASLTQTSISPSLLVYEKSPLYGISFNREVGDAFVTTNKEFSFVGIPLFFGALNRTAEQIVYSWASGSDSKPGSDVTYRIPEGASGTSLVLLEARNSIDITQSAQKTFSVQFGNKN